MTAKTSTAMVNPAYSNMKLDHSMGEGEAIDEAIGNNSTSNHLLLIPSAVYFLI